VLVTNRPNPLACATAQPKSNGGFSVSEATPGAAAPQPGHNDHASVSAREPDAIYQEGKIVARVEGAEVDLDAKEIHFEEIHQSDDLLLPEECEYQRYKILIQRIAYATKAEKVAVTRGRILRGVAADILGFLEQ
jgi:hypothetical protein